MRKKIVHFIKLLLIVTLATALLACVGVFPDRPVFFTFASAACIITIRFLWRSALRDEKMIKRQHIRVSQKCRKLAQNWKQAA